MTLTRADGSRFGNQGECVSYGARDGTPVAFTGCFVLDTTAPSNFSSSSLDTVAAAAAAGDTIDVQGTCIGSSTLPGA